jgi:uncharacterized delta-60 repeat protein
MKNSEFLSFAFTILLTLSNPALAQNISKPGPKGTELIGGSLDTTFNNTGKVQTNLGMQFDLGVAVATQIDGKIVFAGMHYDSITATTNFTVLRYNTNGSMDSPDFGILGLVNVDWGNTPDSAQAAELQPDGRILIAGQAGNASVGASIFSLMRLNGDSPVPALASVAGRLVDSQGRGIPKTSITVINLQTNERNLILTGPSGYFRLDQLKTNSHYRLIFGNKLHSIAGQSFRLTGDKTDLAFVSE